MRSYRLSWIITLLIESVLMQPIEATKLVKKQTNIPVALINSGK